MSLATLAQLSDRISMNQYYLDKGYFARLLTNDSWGGNYSAYRRKMKFFEFETKNVLQKYGIATPKGNIANNSYEAEVIAEELAAQYIGETNYPKPVAAYIAGRLAPPGKRMGHAGAIIMGSTGTAKSKIDAFTTAGVPVAKKPSDIVKLLKV